MKHIISINKLEKNYGSKKALSSFDLNIPSGGYIHGILGPNGSGKTTLMRLINQIYKPDKGYILFNGNKISEKDTNKIGYMPEERGLYKNMYIEEQLIYIGRLKGMSKKLAEKLVKKWVNYFDLDSFKKKTINFLSKGLAQKVQFISTILHQPELIILDEPFSGLDALNINIICNEILLLKKKGCGIIISTHNIKYAENICDKISFIYSSIKILEGTILEIKNKFKKNEYFIEIELYDKNTFSRLLNIYLISEIKNYGNNFCFKIKKSENITLENLIKSLINLGKLKTFKTYTPSIEKIFIEYIKKYKNE